MEKKRNGAYHLCNVFGELPVTLSPYRYLTVILPLISFLFPLALVTPNPPLHNTKNTNTNRPQPFPPNPKIKSKASPKGHRQVTT
ncbi:hypothetical protein VNO77_13893 [Canavalia gladiata]|uniref:Uncharacterized protein n=1 Tax=Canavalia gladiata TaxID=3824 RepID=A0AAN9LYE9_CANGL